MGRKQLWVDDEFDKYLKTFGNDLETRLGFRPSNAKITKALAFVLNEKDLKIEDGKKKKKKKTFELTFVL